MGIKVELRKNGSYQMLVSGGDVIDEAILTAMALRAKENPAALRFTFDGGVAILSVESAK